MKKQNEFVSDSFISEFVKLTFPIFNEREKRLVAASIASILGYGGITRTSKLCNLSRVAITDGIKELKNASSEQTDNNSNESLQQEIPNRIRRPGAGRKKKTDTIPNLQETIEKIVQGSTYGDPERVLYWTTLGLYDITKILKEDYGISISHTLVSSILDDLHYSKQLNQKMMQVGSQHPDRNAQFEYINTTAKEFLDSGDPVISVDTKKKENIGNFKNNGAEYRKSGDPRKVLDHDFPIKELGKVAPYGIYVINNNTGFVNLGTDHDTGEFAVESIRIWWNTIGKYSFPDSKRIYINCDGGGSNGSRNKLWKTELATLAQEIGIDIFVSHFPPGTSKWNKVEHRLFCYISKNWQGHPLIDIETTVNLISSTTTEKGLKVTCVVDNNDYAPGIKISDEQLNRVDIEYLNNLNKWNYKISGFRSE